MKTKRIFLWGIILVTLTDERKLRLLREWGHMLVRLETKASSLLPKILTDTAWMFGV